MSIEYPAYRDLGVSWVGIDSDSRPGWKRRPPIVSIIPPIGNPSTFRMVECPARFF